MSDHDLRTSKYRLFFPRIGVVNRALAAMTNALSAGDHLLNRLAA